MHDTVSGYANGTTVNMMPADGLCFPRFALPPAGMTRAFDQIAVSARERQEKLMLQSHTGRAR